MQKISVKFSYNYLLLVVIVLIINEPPLFFNYPIINTVYKVLQLLLIMYMWMNAIKNKFYNTPTILVTLFSLWNILVTLIFNYTEVIEITYRNMFVLLHVFCVSHFVKNEESDFINIYTKVLGWYSIINCIMFIIRPYGWIYKASGNTAWNLYFLGLDNQFARIMLPSLILLLVSQSKRTRRQWLFLALVFFSDAYVIFQRMPGMLISCFVLVVVFYVVLHFSDISPKVYVIGYGISFGLCVMLQNINLNFINRIIIEILGKDLTFSGRTGIWRDAISLIAQSPIIGYGSTVSRNMVFGISAHNIVLQTILESGIIGLALFLLIIYKSLFVNKEKKYSISILIMGSFIIMVSLLFEVYSLEYFFVIVILVFKYKTNSCKKV